MPFQKVQRIESDRSGGASNDPTVGPVGSFQYSENVDVRNNLAGIQLQSGTLDFDTTALITCYCQTPSHFYKFLQNGKVIVTTHGSIGGTEVTLSGLAVGSFIQDACIFDNVIYAVGANGDMYTIVYGATVATPIIFPANSIPPLSPGRASLLEFWNAQLVVAYGNLLFTKTRGFNEWTLCRKYDTGATIECMAMVGNSIVVYVGYAGGEQKSKAFFLTGTFSQDDTGVAQGNVRSGSIVRNVVNVKGSPVVFGIKNSGSSNTAVSTLHVGSGYDSILIKEGLNSEGVAYMQDEFTLDMGSTTFRKFSESNDTVYIPAKDGLWTYGMNKTSGGFMLCKEYGHNHDTAGTSCVSNEYVFVSYTNGGQSFERRYRVGNNKQPYTSDPGILISRVYDGGKGYKHKKKTIIGLDIGYDLSKTTGGDINVYIRTDRSSYNHNLGRTLVGTISNATQHRFAQSPGVNTNDALGKDFFQLEYKLVLERGSGFTGTPIVGEVVFTLGITENAQKG